MLIHKLKSSVAITFFLMILLSPLIIIDVLIIYFLSGPIINITQLLLLLLMFYIVGFILSIVVDGFMGVLGNLFDLKTPIIVLVGIDFLLSLGVLAVLQSYFTSVQLSVSLMVLIVSVHALVGFLVAKSPEKEEEKDEIESNIENEIKHLLHEKTIVDCINEIRENHPELSKKTVMKEVRRIFREMKRGEKND
ncbi:hypothetical protein ACI2JA_14205 [Alkalihalobacillus sp. NPDC078783]